MCALAPLFLPNIHEPDFLSTTIKPSTIPYIFSPYPDTPKLGRKMICTSRSLKTPKETNKLKPPSEPSTYSCWPEEKYRGNARYWYLPCLATNAYSSGGGAGGCYNNLESPYNLRRRTSWVKHWGSASCKLGFQRILFHWKWWSFIFALHPLLRSTVWKICIKILLMINMLQL